jgi:glycerol kinase
MQFQADLLGRPVVRTSAPDAAALGAAFLVGLATGVLEDEAAHAAISGATGLGEAERGTH